LVFASIDTNGDGVISGREERAYAERVLGDLSLSLDGEHLSLRLVSATFPEPAEMRQGLSAIELELSADVPVPGADRRLVFENRHQRPIAAYLVNTLIPREPGYPHHGPERDYPQARYELGYAQAGAVPQPASFTWWSGARGLLVASALFMFAWPVVLCRRRRPPVRHGIRHHRRQRGTLASASFKRLRS
jgi:hypothetical protein